MWLKHSSTPIQEILATPLVTSEQADHIEKCTIDQADNQLWIVERRKRITASKVGGIAKMRATTKRSKKVQQLLYSSFKGSAATKYGIDNEDLARQKYITYMKEHGQSHLTVRQCGLFISTENPWLAASPDGIVENSTNGPQSQTSGLLEIKNPYSVRKMTLSEAVSKSTFCLEKDKDSGKYRLKQKHDYFYQVQCQLYCTNKAWCDFVVHTEKELHVERIHRQTSWWDSILDKLKPFYFNSLLPELACPRHHKGGIRD